MDRLPLHEKWLGFRDVAILLPKAIIASQILIRLFGPRKGYESESRPFDLLQSYEKEIEIIDEDVHGRIARDFGLAITVDQTRM